MAACGEMRVAAVAGVVEIAVDGAPFSRERAPIGLETPSGCTPDRTKSTPSEISFQLD